MRKKVPPAWKQALVHGYQGGDLEYAKKKSKKPKENLCFCGGRLESDEGHEGAGKPVIASGDAPEFFDSAKEPLHFLPHSVFLFVVEK